jgi:3-oxoadipate CoA-transferase beta subunit
MMTLFGKDGSSKLVEKCTYPLTGVACVSRAYTDHGVFEITDNGVRAREVYGATLDELRERTGITLLD